MIRALLFMTLGCVLLAPMSASADQIKYVGLHPIAQTADGGFCYIEAPHIHVYSPAKKAKVLYRSHDNHHMFVGDPVAYGYEGDRSTYYGHHPIHIDVALGVNAEIEHGEEYCYIDGPHFHLWAPPASAQFEVKGDVHWFVGTFPSRYKKQKRTYARINVVVAPLEYDRPVITIEPPTAWIGIGVGAGMDVRGGAGAAVGVGGGISGGISIDVPPPPTLEFEVGISGGIGVGGGGGVVVGGGSRHRSNSRSHKAKKRSKRRGHFGNSHRKRRKGKSKRRSKKSSKFRW